MLKRKGMLVTRRSRLLLIPIFGLGLSIAAWLLVPAPFVQGVIVGGVAALGMLAGGVLLVARKLRQRLDAKLQPPPAYSPTSQISP